MDQSEIVSRPSFSKEVVFADFTPFSPITEDVRARNAPRIFTGGVRINRSMYRTEEETNEYIAISLARTLP